MDCFQLFSILFGQKVIQDCEPHYRGEGLLLFARFAGSCKTRTPLGISLMPEYAHYLYTLYNFDVLHGLNNKYILLAALYTPLIHFYTVDTS